MQQLRTTSPASDIWSSQRLYRPFVRSAVLIALTLGFAAGAGILSLPALGIDRSLWWLKHAQFHAQAQVFGFAGLFTMGIAFHVTPRFRQAIPPYPVPQRVTLSFVVAGVVLRSFGQAMSQRQIGEIMLYVSGVTLIVGAIVFAGTILMILRSGENSRRQAEAWIFTACFWVMAAAAIHLVGVFDMANNGAPLVDGAWQRAFVYATMFGFVGNYIFGVSTRAVVGFMNLRDGFWIPRWSALPLLNAGTAIFVASLLWSGSPTLTGVGLILLGTGLASFVISLRVYEPPTKKRAFLVPAYVRYTWFVRTAYAWLLVGALLIVLTGIELAVSVDILPALSASPIIHVVGLGFVTMIIMGVSIRMVPLFEGSVVPYSRAMDAAFVLLNASVALRLLFGLVGNGASDTALAISGILGLAAMIAYSAPITMSMRSAARDEYTRLTAGLGADRLHQIQTYRASKVPRRPFGQ